LAFPSSPRRRSSDLDHERRRDEGLRNRRSVEGCSGFQFLFVLLFLVFGEWKRDGLLAVPLRGLSATGRDPRAPSASPNRGHTLPDRKSTRLNSSHQI